jgi:hypothetical protein
MAGESYVGWDELDDDDPVGGDRPGLAEAAAGNDRLATLLTERARLVRELDRLLGREPPSDDDKRENARFPMPIHTAESRLEERRLAREEVRVRAAAKRALEAARLRAREENARAAHKREQEREAVQREVLRRVEEARRRELVDDLKRARRLAETLAQRWSIQRGAALRARETARRAEWTVFDERSRRMRERAEAVSAERKRDWDEFYRRLDERAERARQSRRRSAGD